MVRRLGRLSPLRSRICSCSNRVVSLSPGMAPGTLAADWDSTCVEGVWPGRNGAWLPGAVDTLSALVRLGWTVTIHTCRIAPVLRNGARRKDSAVQRELDAIRRRLDRVGLTEVRIHTDPWKPTADVYLDDKGMRFTSWECAAKELIGDTSTGVVPERERDLS